MADRIESSAPETSSVIETRVDPTSARYEANMRFMADLVSQIHNEEETICEGGGQKAIENQHSKGRLTARERIKLLVDPGTFFELGAYSAHGMYEEWGGAPAAGVITALVQAAIGQKISAEELGGAAMHSAISGTVDFRAASDEACLAEIRSIVEKWGYRRQSPWHRKKPVEPAMAAEELYGIYDSSPARPYDMKEILARIVDGSRFDEYKPEYGKTVICAYARIGGFACGFVANQT